MTGRKCLAVGAFLLSAGGCATYHGVATESELGARSLQPAIDSVSPLAPPSALTPAMPPGELPPATPAGRPSASPDPQMQAELDELAKLHVAPIESLPPVAARGQPSPRDGVRGLLRMHGKTLPPAFESYDGVNVADRKIPGPGGPLPVRVYTPMGKRGPLPVVVYYHGGGWVIADVNAYDGGARGIAKQANAIVVSVDYRRAPEHKFPAAHDDALAAYRWVTANAAAIGGDPRRIATAGESAGGNLCVATAMLARDAGLPMPVAVISVYPIAQPDTTTASYTENAFAKPLDRAAMSWFFGYYTRTPADRRDSRIDLVHANLHGLPPVTIINAQIDPLRDDGLMLEQALHAAGVPVERRVYDGVTHEFFGLTPVIDKAADAERFAAERLRQAFGQ